MPATEVQTTIAGGECIGSGSRNAFEILAQGLNHKLSSAGESVRIRTSD